MAESSCSKPGSASSLQKVRLHPCNYCQKQYSKKCHLQRHIKTHLGPPDLHCTLCNYSTYYNSHLADHYRSHTKEKPYKCLHPNCSAAFSTSCGLKTHQIVHKKGDPSLVLFKCPAPGCSYTGMSKGALRGHSRVHSMVKPLACDLCPYRAKLNREIVKHHKYVHSTERPFKCPRSDCNFSCKSKGKLKRHEVVHSVEKPFVCSVPGCKYKGKSKEQLRVHEKVHGGEKTFKCGFCPFSSIHKGNLVVHTRGHTGETPFACQSCSFQGKCYSTLASHVKNRHNNLVKKSRGCKPKLKKVIHPVQSPTGSFTYKCKVLTCDFLTVEPSSLALHLNAAHHLPRVNLPFSGTISV